MRLARLAVAFWLVALSSTAFAQDAAPAPVPRIKAVSINESQVRIEFDQPMLTWATRAETAALRVEPALPCEWFWEDDTRLACDGDGLYTAVRDASTYRVVIEAPLWSQAGVAIEPTTRVVETERPKVNVGILNWKAAVPAVRITINQAVDPASLAGVLTVTVDGEAVPFRLDPESDEGTAFDLEAAALATRTGILEVAIRPGLRGLDGPLPGTQEQVLLRARLGEPFRLRKIVCRVPGEDSDTKENEVTLATTPVALANCLPQHPIQLVFSRALDPDGLARLQAVLPPGWTAEAGNTTYDYSPSHLNLPKQANGERVVVLAKAAANAVALVLPPDLTSRDGARLAPTPAIAISTGDYPPGAEVTPGVLRLAPGNEAQPTATSHNLPAGLDLERVTIGARARYDRMHWLGSRERNVEATPALPPTPAAVRDAGGLVLVGAPVDEDFAYLLAYAPFDVVSQVSDEGPALVWASRWGDPRGLDGAEVELLDVTVDGKETVVSRARTDAGGVAMLEVPDKAPDDGLGLGWFVRVTHGGLRTVAPLEYGELGLPGPAHYSDWTGPDKQFGVTDRALYRPGETVRYRLWWRKRVGNHLVPRAAPARMTLVRKGRWRGDEKLLREWPTVADALGGMSGDVELPARLDDGTYCIVGAGDDADEEDEEASGACFAVARFDAQPVWAQLAADRTVVQPGDVVTLDADAGFFSGGPAPGAALEFSGALQAIDLGAVYPRFARYEFMKSGMGVDAMEQMPDASPPDRADARGTARFRFAVPTFPGRVVDDPPVAFGRLNFNVGVSAAGRATATSAPVSITYARYPRFVGLASEGWWSPLDRDVVLDAVVVTHLGDAVADVPVDVRIEASSSPWSDARHGDDDAVAAKALGHCKLLAGHPANCPFRAPEPGWYRFIASAADAAPTEMVRWIGGRAPDVAEDGPAATLELVQAGDAATPARVRLRQPYAAAQALFVLEYEGVRTHWVQAVASGDTDVDVPLRAEWAPGVTVRAVVRRADGDATPFAAKTLGAALDLAIARPDVALRVEVAPSPAKPGQEIVLRLRNPGGAVRHATIALVDDSVHQQASAQWASFDPASDGWLGSLEHWGIGDWYALEEVVDVANPFAASERERAMAVSAPRGFDDPSSAELDTIVVTGTRIQSQTVTASSPVVEITDRLPPGRRPERLPLGPRLPPGEALAQVRQRFLDTAYWNPDVEVPAGETRELRVPLPDNLTRWRVLVWTSDAGDGFALTEATVPSELPVELRLGLPARLFPGDRSLATVSARNHTPSGVVLALTLQGEGAGLRVDEAARGRVAAEAELAHRVALAPLAVGALALVARAESGAGADALASTVAVASRRVLDQETQVGWIDAQTLSLPLPDLPEGAIPVSVDVEVRHGVGRWLDGWLADLRDYPHRCWEQSLSRALGAALAVDAHEPDAFWPGAAALVDKTLAEAPAFQGDDGRFHYFLSERQWSGDGSPLLSAWTLRAFDRLRTLGYTVHARLYDPLANAVQKDAKPPKEVPPGAFEPIAPWEIAAVASGALIDAKRLDEAMLRRIWARWDTLSWHARSELVRALARKPALAALAREGLGRLRGAGTRHGLRQVIDDRRDYGFAMGSLLRDQCAVVATLFELDLDPAGEPQRTALLRGLADLYAGGTSSLDTQASVHCALAMRAAAPRLPTAAATAREVQVAFGAIDAALTLQDDVANWSAPAPFAGDALQLRGPDPVDPTLNFAATLRYESEAMQAPAQAVGLRLERRYAVLRGGEWLEVPAPGVREGEWVRVTLRVAVPAWRHFVAITDPVPGGLVTRDIALAGVGTAALRAAGDRGSWWFDSRQTGATEVRLYAESLPPGTHEVHYFAQAVHPGEYLAPPAIAELMYGRGSRATTTGDTVRIQAAK